MEYCMTCFPNWNGLLAQGESIPGGDGLAMLGADFLLMWKLVW